jgi:hypothetical protein
VCEGVCSSGFEEERECFVIFNWQARAEKGDGFIKLDLFFDLEPLSAIILLYRRERHSGFAYGLLLMLSIKCLLYTFRDCATR